MDRFEHVLYLERRLRGTQRGFTCALEVAREHGAALTVAGLPYEVTGGARRGSVRPSVWRQDLDRRWRARLGELAGAARDRGVARVATCLISGAEELPSGVDLVMTVAHRDSLQWPYRFAERERALVESCSCPVWILHPAQGPRLRVVLAGVDVSREGAETLNRRILRTATALARTAGAELHLVHAWSLPAESLLGSRNRGGSPRGVRRLLTSAEADRRQAIARLLEDERVQPPPRVLLRKGKPLPSLEDAAWRREADVVVLGTSGRGGIGRLLFPGTVERLLGRVPASVLAVKAAPESAPAPA